MSETEYNFQLIEKKPKYWEENKSFEVEPDPKKKILLLSMFPIPQDSVIWDM